MQEVICNIVSVQPDIFVYRVYNFSSFSYLLNKWNTDAGESRNSDSSHLFLHLDIISQDIYIAVKWQDFCKSEFFTSIAVVHIKKIMDSSALYTNRTLLNLQRSLERKYM